MEINVYSVSRDRSLASGSIAELKENRENPKGLYWVDVTDPEPVGLTDLLSSLSVHPLIADRCLDPDASAVVASHPDTVFAHFPAMGSWEDPGRSYLSILCLPHAIVTIQSRHAAALDPLTTNFAVALDSHGPSPASILYLILDRLIDEATASALEARRAVDQLEELINEGRELEQLSRRMLGMKRAVAHFEIGIEEQHRCLAALLSLETTSFSVRDLSAYYHDALSHVEHDLRYVERIEDRLSDLQRHHLLLLQDRTNQRLKNLTVLSAVFMPLMLITGIYGMNFENMPELAWRYGYFFILALMVALAVGLVWLFYREDWFK